MTRHELAVMLTCKLNFLRHGSAENPSYVRRFNRLMRGIYHAGGKVVDHGHYSEAIL